MNHTLASKFSRPLNIRVSPDFLETVREAALLAQIPLSSWMRDRMWRAARLELRATEDFPKLTKQVQSPQPSSHRKESPLPAIAEAPAQEIKKWITRFRKEFSIAIEGGRVVSVKMLQNAGGAKYEKFSFGGTSELERRVREEIEEYIRGARKSFDLPLDLSSVTPFSQDVLHATAQIPFGETRSYKWVAETSGRPKAVRAVGQALHRNPISILIP